VEEISGVTSVEKFMCKNFYGNPSTGRPFWEILRFTVFTIFFTIFFIIFFFSLPSFEHFSFMGTKAFLPSCAFGEEPRNVTLDAERVSYDDASGKASAQGNAVLTYGGTTIRAERIDYDAVSQRVKASPLPGETVVLQGMGNTVTGEGLEYDLDSGEGVLTGARSNLPAGEGTLYVTGEIQVLPYDLAAERGLVGGKAQGSFVVEGKDVSITTCALDHPHYRIEAKSIVFVPGRRVVAKKPRLYLGDTFIFTYPLDYIVQIDRKAMRHSLMPHIQNSEEKGTGAGFSGAFGWDTGSLGLGMTYWSETGLEWMAEIEQGLGGGFSVEAGVQHSWDKAWREKKYRPRASLLYEHKGWQADLRWSRDEYIEDRKDSLHEYRGRLDRKPEFSVLTPWMKEPVLGLSQLRLNAIGGSYRETTPDFANDTITRYGAVLQSYAEVPLGKGAEFFLNSRYGAWFYDKDNSDQEIAEGLVGLRYLLGALEMASGYEHRRVWGESPMLWDAFRDAERLHQKIRFPLGQEIFFALRGSYDLNESMVDEVHYALQWISDCMKWELLYHDERTSDAEDKISLSVSILAFPNTPASFGEYKDADPFDRPRDLPGRRVP
jgi:LPS-assembly protein